MAINISQAFHRTSANPVDESMALTKAQMLTVNDNLMPDYYFTICQDDGDIYMYDKSATPSGTTGKFSKLETGGGGGGGTGVVITETLTSSGWNSSNQQTLTFTGYTTDMGGVIGMPTNATAAQKEAFAEAIIDVVAQNGNQLTFHCENVPSVNLPVTLYAGGSGGSGSGVPAGGTTGQALVKRSSTDGDVEWSTINSIPNGGSTGQALVKHSATDKDVEWADTEKVQYDTMPTAAASNVGLIVQFVGTTNANYTNGLFYKCINNSGTYSWELCDVQEAQGLNSDSIQDIIGSASLSNYAVTGGNTYSTSEQIVGRWIDGKPLYQKTITGTSPANNTATVIGSVASLVAANAKIKNMFGYIEWDSGTDSGVVMIPNYSFRDQQNSVNIWVGANSASLYMECMGSLNFSRPFTLTIQYTKTTD